MPIDGRISWLPASATGHESINAYLLREEDHALLVDTGVAYHRELVLAQLHELLPKGSALRVFLTRAEADCLTNLDAIMGEFDLAEVYAGGVLNPFDFFDEILDEVSRDELVRSYDLRVVRKEPGERIEVFRDREVVILSAPIRLLTTFWAFDTGTGTLFTSDSFGHVQLATAQDSRVLDDAEGTAGSDNVEDWLLTKFDWFAGADTGPARRQIDEIFATHAVERLAPVHGRVISGRRAVEQHVEALDQVLAAVGRS